MARNVRAAVVDRDGLADALVGRTPLLELSEPTLVEKTRTIPSRGGLIVTWAEEGIDPLPDLLVVRDNDYVDTLAWTAAFLGPLTPLTQWCRLLTVTQAGELFRSVRLPSLRPALGPWIGTIVAECVAQATSRINLRELPGAAAQSTASYAAARAMAVHGSSVSLEDLAERHDEVVTRLRTETRPLTALQILSVWKAIAGNGHAQSVTPHDPAFDVIRLLFDVDALQPLEAKIQVALDLVRDEFDLPAISDCARGPQPDRVTALDGLVAKISSGPRSKISDALIGFAASLVEPGASALPDLLRKHLRAAPTAPVWLGAFAGLWDPMRVLNDHQGLGRLIAKALLTSSDLRSKPSCDIAFDELMRWIGTSAPNKVPVRGMGARTLLLEIIPGVTCSLSVSRGEAVRHDPPPSSANVQQANLGVIETQGEGVRRPAVGDEFGRMQGTLQSLLARVGRLETALDDVRSWASSQGANHEGDLFAGREGGAERRRTDAPGRPRRGTKDRSS